jgi:uncharacterized repeat protein (TIGR01451 family)
MKRLLTHLFLVGMFILSLTSVSAQILWPTADTTTIRVSQFADAATIRFVKSDTALSATLNAFKGWITMGISSNLAAKKDSAVWLWSADGSSRMGAYGSTVAVSGSDVTRGKGAAIFSSDFLDNRGIPNTNFGKGPEPSPNKGELWSPIIDATGTKDLKVYFNSVYRHYTKGASMPCIASTGISWSEDGGATWKPIVCIAENNGYGQNESDRNGPLSVRLQGSVGTNKFRFKFIFDGDYYHWTVDDVKLGAPKYDLRVDPEWAAFTQTDMQKNNLDTIRFMADVINNGSATAKNVKLTASILDNATQAVVYSVTRNYGDLKADSTAQNEITGLGYVLPSTVKAYDIRYALSSDSTDAFAADNTVTFAGANGINVRDSLMSMDRNDGRFLYKAGYTLNSTGTYSVGNYYYFPRGASSTAVRISAYIGETDPTDITAPRPYTVFLYEWNDLNRNDSIEVNERVLIAAGETSIPAGFDTDLPINFRLQSYIDSKPVFLKNNQAYLAMFEVSPNRGAPWYAGFDDRARFSYESMKFVTKKSGKPRYAGIFAENNNINAVWDTDGGRLTPKVSLWAYPFRVGTKDDLPDTYKINIYPNPVGQTLSVNLDFPKSEEAILCRVYDLKGQLIQEKEFWNVQKETVSMDVNTLANGSYTLQVQTLGNQAKTLKFVKAN